MSALFGRITTESSFESQRTQPSLSALVPASYGLPR
jgi:hypothetical protein